jgi:hypothetical protein
VPSPCVANAPQRILDAHPVVEQVSQVQKGSARHELDQLVWTFEAKIGELAAQVTLLASIAADADLRASTFEPTSWRDVATSLFPNTREMTPDESQQFAEIHRRMLTPVTKPTRKLRPR